MAISRRVRFEVLRRDAHTCRYCGASAPDATLTVDHVIPVALGGGDEPSNLVTACRDCNAGKASIAPDQALVDDVDATALLFAKAMERAAAMRRADHQTVLANVQAFDDRWQQWWHGEPEDKLPVPRPDDWQPSVERFVELGLDGADLVRFVDVAMPKGADDAWRYFCGCCWREITDRQELARRLIEDGQV